MKQVLQDRSGNTVVRDVPPPSCEPGNVLVANAYSVISAGTERSRVQLSSKSLLGKARERPDLVRQAIERARREGISATREAVKRKLQEETPVGYSSAGVVVEVAAGVAGFDVGDHVACAGATASHAEVVAVPANLCAQVPEDVALPAAAMTTLGAIALHGVRLADVRVGDRVAVVGCGLVGQITVRLLLAAGAEVFAVDLDASRIEQARAAGAHHGFIADDSAAGAVRAAAGGVGVDEVLVTAAASTNAPLLLAAACARDRGALVLVGDVPVEMPRAPLFEKELSFRISRSYGPGRYDPNYEERGLDYPIGYVRWSEKRNMESVLVLQEQGKLRLEELIDSVVPVDEAPHAYGRLIGAAGQPPRGALVLAYGEHAVTAPPTEPIAVDVSPAAAPGRRAATTATARIGLIGPGSFSGRVLVPALQAAGAQLELVGGGAGRSAEAATRTLGFRRVAESAEALIADPEVDAVVVATRHGTHAALTRAALEAGKHVFCEKPLALTHDELDGVLAAAQTAPGILAVGFNRRFSPFLEQAREFVAGSEPLAAVYRVSAGALPPDHWVHDLEHGGGRVIGEVCHFVDSLAFVAGSRVERVHAAGFGAPDVPVQARDNVVANLVFENGSVGAIVYVAEGSPKVPKERLEVFAGARTAILDDYQTLELHGGGKSQPQKLRTQDKGHNRELQLFVDGVRTGRPPVPLDEIANVSLATLGLVESLRTGRPVWLRPEQGST